MVTDLIRATPEADVLRRDIFDRPPVGRWVDGRVALLGDSAHAMQPNLGQGGGMAIEDAFQLVEDLGAEDAAAAAEARPRRVDSVLSGYFRKRVLRAAAIHGMAGSAAFMASTYKAYLGEGLGPLEAMTALRIPHPGRVGGQLVMALAMPGVLSWVLGGYGGALAKSGRPGACRLEDAPAGFAEPEYARLISDDDAILRAARAEWVLQPAAAAAALGPDDDPYTACVPVPPAAGLDLGAAPGAGGLAVDAPGVAPRHARVERRGEDYFLVDAAAADAAGGAAAATLLNGRRLAPGEAARLRPGDEFALGAGGAGGKPAAGAAFRVKMRHLSLAAGNDGAPYDRRRGLAPPAAAAH
jgi:zeaxanthin epoxidase